MLWLYCSSTMRSKPDNVFMWRKYQMMVDGEMYGEASSECLVSMQGCVL